MSSTLIEIIAAALTAIALAVFALRYLADERRAYMAKAEAANAEIVRRLEAQIAELKTERAALQAELKAANERIEIILGETGDVKQELGFETGVRDADYMKAKMQERIERVGKPDEDEAEQHKRGGSRGKH